MLGTDDPIHLGTDGRINLGADGPIHLPFWHSMPKNDTLIFLANKRLPAGTIYITFLIYVKTIYGQKMKEIDFSTLATKSVFCSIFPDRRS